MQSQVLAQQILRALRRALQARHRFQDIQARVRTVGRQKEGVNLFDFAKRSAPTEKPLTKKGNLLRLKK